jgi:hypothetical protein
MGPEPTAFTNIVTSGWVSAAPTSTLRPRPWCSTSGSGAFGEAWPVDADDGGRRRRRRYVKIRSGATFAKTTSLGARALRALAERLLNWSRAGSPGRRAPPRCKKAWPPSSILTFRSTLRRAKSPTIVLAVDKAEDGASFLDVRVVPHRRLRARRVFRNTVRIFVGALSTVVRSSPKTLLLQRHAEPGHARRRAARPRRLSSPFGRGPPRHPILFSM